ncbi:glycosyltransferase [Neokomagataea tanensis]|uniref:glycosyltransferase n=1 Tax=Neokomagataea TaxID=1223423 RepID=UPI001F10B4FB|nr:MULTISPECIES: glycosyltransferase family 2 protein [Neokomagataea]
MDNLRRLRKPSKVCAGHFVSVLIPARNEEKTIRRAVEAVLNSRDIGLELIVLDDASTDATLSILKGFSDPRLKVLSGQKLPENWCGKTHACAQLAQAAQHELMVFVDADVRLEPDALTKLCTEMSRRPDIALLSGVPRQVTKTVLEWMLLPFIHLLLMGYLPMRLDDGTEAKFAAACGQLIIVRRTLYSAVGGHAAVKGHLHDGLALARHFRASGLKTGLLDATDIASCRMYESASEVWSGLKKNATEGMATPRGLPVWTALLCAGHVLPFCLPRRPYSWLAMILSITTRILLARRFEQGVLTVLFSPVGVVVLLLLQWQALVSEFLGYAPQWRGRSYPRRFRS